MCEEYNDFKGAQGPMAIESKHFLKSLYICGKHREKNFRFASTPRVSIHGGKLAHKSPHREILRACGVFFESRFALRAGQLCSSRTGLIIATRRSTGTNPSLRYSESAGEFASSTARLIVRSGRPASSEKPWRSSIRPRPRPRAHFARPRYTSSIDWRSEAGFNSSVPPIFPSIDRSVHKPGSKNPEAR